MAKLFALSRIILPATDKNGEEKIVLKGKVFDATPEQAKQFDALKAARPATADEIKDAKAENDKANGIVKVDDEAGRASEPGLPASGAAGDPNSPPKPKAG